MELSKTKQWIPESRPNNYQKVERKQRTTEKGETS